MATIMTREHPQWDQFIQILEGILYFHEIENEDGEPDIAWHCESDFTQTTAVLNFMISLGILKDIDIDGTIEYFQENGGYCDCEVLFNVDDDNDDDDEDDDDDDDTPLEEDKDFEEFRIHRELPAHVLGTGTYVDECGNGTFEIQIDSFNGARVIMRQNDNDDTEVTHYLMPDDMVTAILNEVRRDQPIEFTVNNVNRPALNDVDPSDIFEM
jgi:hypothetical protein